MDRHTGIHSQTPSILTGCGFLFSLELPRHDQGRLRRPVGKFGIENAAFQHFWGKSGILLTFWTEGRAPFLAPAQYSPTAGTPGP